MEPKPIFLVDIDGTLADLSHRLHFIHGQEKPNWDGFFAACADDLPNTLKSINLYAEKIGRNTAKKRKKKPAVSQ